MTTEGSFFYIFYTPQYRPWLEILCFQVVCMYVLFLLKQYFRTVLKEVLQSWHKCLLGLKDELMRFGGQKSTLLWPHVYPIYMNVISQEHLVGIISLNFALQNVERWTDQILVAKGQDHCDIMYVPLSLTQYLRNAWGKFYPSSTGVTLDWWMNRLEYKSGETCM